MEENKKPNSRKKTRNTAHRGGRGSKAGKKPTHERRVTPQRQKKAEVGPKKQQKNLHKPATEHGTPTRPGGERTEEGAGRRQKTNKKSKGKDTEGYRKRNLNRSQNHSRKAEEGGIKGELKSNNRTTWYDKKHGTRREGRAQTASWRR